MDTPAPANVRPPTRTEPIMVNGVEVGWRVVHDGPCVFTTNDGERMGQCSCGRLDLGIVR